MLKTIRNTIVGMMKRLRIEMSLRPRDAALEEESSVVIIVVAKTCSHSGKMKRRRHESLLREALLLLTAAVLLERGVPVPCQRVQHFLGRTIAVHDVRIHTLVELL